MGILSTTAWFLRALLVPRLHLIIENLARRQQLATYRSPGKRPKLKPRDRLFWVLLRRFWSGWRSVLVIVQPETVVRWHRLGFRLYWRWKSAWGKRGRPKVARELRDLIRRMSRENVTWGAPRIADELRLLGYDVCCATVAKYMVREPKPPSLTWRTFLANHAHDIAACDFFTMPTATFRVLYCFVVIRHDTRRIVHFNVTEHPTAAWTGQQIVNAFPYDEAPRYLLRDNDGIYGEEFLRRVKSLDIEEVKTAVRSPWQNPYAVGTAVSLHLYL
jgi:putative transposase